MTNLTISQKLKNRTLVGYEMYDRYQYPNYIQTSGSTIDIFSEQRQISINDKAEKIYEVYNQPEENIQTEDFSLLFTKNIFEDINSDVENISNQELKEFSTYIIDLIKDIINSYLILDLPKFYSFIRDDGSLLIEWPFDHYKIGFSIENKLNESSWYFISNEKFGFFNAIGDLQNENLVSILNWLFPYIIENKKN